MKYKYSDWSKFSVNPRGYAGDLRNDGKNLLYLL